VWGRKKRPAPEQLAPRNDIAEAREIRRAATAGLNEVRGQSALIQSMTDALIDRQGRNHYIEQLYEYIPKGVA